FNCGLEMLVEDREEAACSSCTNDLPGVLDTAGLPDHFCEETPEEICMMRLVANLRAQKVAVSIARRADEDGTEIGRHRLVEKVEEGQGTQHSFAYAIWKRRPLFCVDLQIQVGRVPAFQEGLGEQPFDMGVKFRRGRATALFHLLLLP